MKSSFRRIIGIITAAFFAFALLMTFVSMQTYHNALPRVTVEAQRSGTISRICTASAQVRYKESTTYVVPVMCKVTEVYVEAGDLVSAGDAILQLNTAELQAEAYRVQIEIETLKDGINRLAENSPEYGLLLLQKTEQEEKLSQIETLLADEGIVKSADTGIVLTVSAKAKTTAAVGQILAETAVQSENLTLEWYFDEEVSTLFNLGHTVEATLSSSTIVFLPGSDASADTLQVTEKEGRRFSCTLSNIHHAYLLPGDTVDIIMHYTSRHYDHLIPISAVRFLENNTKGQAFILQERERIFGVEQYVTEVSFSVLEYDNINVAADVAAGFNPDNLVVSFTSKSLSDGQAVRE